MKVQEVELTKLDPNPDHELSDTFYRICVFCDKVVRITPANFKSCINLSNGNFHCPFCLRHNHHHRSSRNILVLSFRAIAAYYYYRFYIDKKTWVMYVGDIEEGLDSHEQIGIQNPVFTYDTHTMLWFIDFNRVGSDSHKAPISEVIDTLRQMLDSFHIETYVSKHCDSQVWGKFEKAVTLYYQKRKRPKGKKILIPTLAQTGVANETEDFWDKTREFVHSHLNVR